MVNESNTHEKNKSVRKNSAHEVSSGMRNTQNSNQHKNGRSVLLLKIGIAVVLFIILLFTLDFLSLQWEKAQVERKNRKTIEKFEAKEREMTDAAYRAAASESRSTIGTINRGNVFWLNITGRKEEAQQYVREKLEKNGLRHLRKLEEQRAELHRQMEEELNRNTRPLFERKKLTAWIRLKDRDPENVTPEIHATTGVFSSSADIATNTGFIGAEAVAGRAASQLGTGAGNKVAVAGARSAGLMGADGPLPVGDVVAAGLILADTVQIGAEMLTGKKKVARRLKQDLDSTRQKELENIRKTNREYLSSVSDGLDEIALPAWLPKFNENENKSETE